MNYAKIYNSLIEKAKPRGLDKSQHEGYFEIHHIVPRCMGGSNDPENLVMFTAREHILAHILLWKAYPKHLGVVNAAFMMIGTRECGKISTKVLASLRELYSKQRTLRKEGAGNGATRHINLSGNRYGRLVVLDTYDWHTFPSGQRKAKWDCVCDCGNKVKVIVSGLQSGLTQSCGCYMKDRVREVLKKWHFSKETVAVWQNMRNKCYGVGHKSSDKFKKYGIEMCPSWVCSETGLNSFVEDMGEKPDGLCLIRLDPYKDFCKDNCRWVTKQEASRVIYKFPRKPPESGRVGVKLDKRRGTYSAKITVGGKEISKACESFEAAVALREEWEREYGEEQECLKQ